MITVLLYGSDNSTELTSALLGCISAINSSVLYLTANLVSLPPANTQKIDFMVIDNMNINSVCAQKGIVVFKQDISGISNLLEIPNEFIAVTDPENTEAVIMLQKNGMQTITCGLSQKDTLTYSSIDAERAMISLQREIKTIDGETVYPMEIPIKLKSIHGDYPALASFAVLLLSGIDLKETELEF